MTSAQDANVIRVLPEAAKQPAAGVTPPRWRPAAEAAVIPVAAVIVGLLIFGLFCATQGANPLGVFKAIYKAAFGS